MFKKNLIVVLFPVFTFAQTNSTVLYYNIDMEPCQADSAKYYRLGLMVDGIPQGDIKDYYRSGKIFMQGQYNENNEPYGHFYYYYENGQKKEQGHFVKDVYRVQKAWDESGTLVVKHGKGELKEFYENGALKSEGHFNHGLRDGIWNFYNRNGEKYETGEYKGGIYYINNVWNKNGKLLVENGTGTYTSYYSNGVIRFMGKYKDGLRTGQWVWNFSNGKPERVGAYEEGLETGQHFEYYNSGKFRSKSNYENGLLNGVYLCYYNTNGRIRYSCEFKNGQLSSEIKYFDQSGKLISSHHHYNSHDPHWQSFNTRIVQNKWW